MSRFKDVVLFWFEFFGFVGFVTVASLTLIYGAYASHIFDTVTWECGVPVVDYGLLGKGFLIGIAFMGIGFALMWDHLRRVKRFRKVNVGVYDKRRF